MTTQIISPSGQKNYAFGTYDTSQAYRQGDSIVYNGNIYTANDNIPANTPFAEGSTGTTWGTKVAGLPASGLTELVNGTSSVSVVQDANTIITIGSTVYEISDIAIGVQASASPAPSLNGFSTANVENVITGSLTANGNVTLGAVANVHITGGGSGQALITDGAGNLSWSTAAAGGNYKYTKEWHVDPVGGNDTLGNGAYTSPYATIAKAFTQVGGNGQAVFLHHGIYNETITCGLFNVDIVGDIRGGAFQQGTWNFTTNGNSSVRVSGLHFSNTVTHSGNAGVYLYDCTVSGALSKTGNGYFEASGLSADSNAWSITGNGYATVTNSRLGSVTVNNAGAIVTLKDLNAVYTVNNASGTTVIDNSYVFSLSNTSNAITSAAGSVTYVQDSQISSAAGAPTARVAMSGFWSVKNTIFDRANSVLGTNLGTVARSDSIDVIGNISGNTAGFALGYRDIPQVAVAANATFALTDAGKHYYNTTAANFTLTVPNNSSVAFNTGSAITVVNQSANTLTIAQGTGVTMYMTGNATAGNRTLGSYGMATLMKVGTDTWFVSGSGVA